MFIMFDMYIVLLEKQLELVLSSIVLFIVVILSLVAICIALQYEYIVLNVHISNVLNLQLFQ